MTGYRNQVQPRKIKKQNTAQQNYPGSVDFYHTRSGNEVGLFYSSRAHTGPSSKADAARIMSNRDNRYCTVGCNCDQRLHYNGLYEWFERTDII